MRLEGIDHLKICEDPTGNRNRNPPSCGAVPYLCTCLYHNAFTMFNLLNSSLFCISDRMNLNIDRRSRWY